MKWMVLGWLMVAGTASAQTAMAPRSVTTVYGEPYRDEPAISPGFFPRLRQSDTPTTLQQRAERAEMVFARYPELRQQFANNPNWFNSLTYRNAERRVRWEQIRAREAQH